MDGLLFDGLGILRTESQLHEAYFFDDDVEILSSAEETGSNFLADSFSGF